jgi:hypothetical protein
MENNKKSALSIIIMGVDNLYGSSNCQKNKFKSKTLLFGIEFA